MATILIHLIANALALVGLAEIIPDQVSYEGAAAVALFAVILGVINALIRPVLQFLALPLTCLTLGLFALVVNALLFYVGARLSPGIDVSYWGALAGTIVAGVLNGVLSEALRNR